MEKVKRVISQRNAVGAVLVFLFTFVVFGLSHVRQVADSNYSMLLSQSLLRHQSFTLDGYALPRLPPNPQVGYVADGSIYQLEWVDGHLYYFFPPGSAVLSAPGVALLNRAGLSASAPDGTYYRNGEEQIEARLAALLMAGLCSVIFLTARLLLPPGWSVLIALGSAFGTQIWSTTSRGMWADTWGTFLLGLAVWMLAGVETERWRLRPVALATLMAWLYIVRPTYSIPIAAITLYVLMQHRALFLRYAAVALLWLVGFVAYSQYHFHQMLPNYYQANRLSFGAFGLAFAGNLISPSRGLLVFVPVLWFVGYLLLRYRRGLALPRLVVLSLGVILVHLVIVSGFTPWHGGYCYGPRYSAGLVPWFALLAIIAVAAWRQAPVENNALVSRLFRRGEAIASALLLLCSIAINGAGALSFRTSRWNVEPVSVDVKPERVWDWRHPQFLAWCSREGG